jgi:hypothetical protein
MRFDTVRCGIVGQTQSWMQSLPKVLQPVAIRVYDAAGNLIETLEHKGEFKEP